MSWIDRLRPKIKKETNATQSRVPEGLWNKCPKCDQVIYSHELEASLMVCPKCGYQTMANYSLLYHDVEHGMMIQYIATPDREERAKEMAEYRKARKESIEAAKAQDPALAKQLYGSVFRFVTSLNDLREKALILRAGLDDRYVELVKAYIMPQAANMKPDLGIESVRFFLDKDGKQYLYFFDKDGKEAGSCDFDMESYNAFKNGLSLVEADTDIIDTGWAREVISEIESQDTFQG